MMSRGWLLYTMSWLGLISLRSIESSLITTLRRRSSIMKRLQRRCLIKMSWNARKRVLLFWLSTELRMWSTIRTSFSTSTRMSEIFGTLLAKSFDYVNQIEPFKDCLYIIINFEWNHYLLWRSFFFNKGIIEDNRPSSSLIVDDIF